MDELHHVAVQVEDVGAAVDWYRERFGCETEYRDDSWALLRFENLHLTLVLPEQHPPHVAVRRPDAAVFGDLSEHRDGTRSVYVEDPWGNSIEVLESSSLDN